MSTMPEYGHAKYVKQYWDLGPTCWTMITMSIISQSCQPWPWYGNHVNHAHGLTTKSTMSMVYKLDEARYDMTMGHHVIYALYDYVQVLSSMLMDVNHGWLWSTWSIMDVMMVVLTTSCQRYTSHFQVDHVFK